MLAARAIPAGMAVKFDLPPAWKRVPYSAEFVFIGPNWAGQPIRMEVRNAPGDVGEPLVGLSNVASGEGVVATYEAAFEVTPPKGDPFTAPATRLAIRINETTLEAVSLGTPYDHPVSTFYDIHVGTGSAKTLIMHGKLPIQPGVTL